MRNVSLKVLVKSLKFLFKKGYEPWINHRVHPRPRTRFSPLLRRRLQGGLDHVQDLLRLFKGNISEGIWHCSFV